MASTTGPIADELRKLRGTHVSLRELARRTGIHHTSLGRYESGRLTPSVEHLAKILDELDVKDPERERLLALVRRDSPGQLFAGVPSSGRQLAQLIGYERAAARITDVSPLRLPGLLQTPDYARAVLGEGPDIDRRVNMRVERAEILTRAAHPVELHALIDSTVLTRPIASPAVMREQLRHILQLTSLPTITVQVVPADMPGRSPHHAGPFIVIEFADATPIVHLEHYRSSGFLWDSEDVRSYLAAADEITSRAMTPEHSSEVIAEIAETETI
jgi:transcriptional regulator with XRE-family HTH domain